MKALEKDRSRRYETANGLAMDIRRYLAGEPVFAAPPSASYRLQKLVRRHKGAVAAGSLIAASLLVGVVGFAWQARVAKARADELEQVSKFQAAMLGQVDPAEAGKLLSDDVRSRFAAALAKAGVPEPDRAREAGAFTAQWQRVNATDIARDLIDRTILKPAIQAVDKQFTDQPLVDATLRSVLAGLYAGMGMFDVARPLEERTLTTRRRLLGDDNPGTLESINKLGEVFMGQGKLSEAETYYREGLAGRRRVLGEEHPDTLISINNVGLILKLQGKLTEAEPYYREALEKCRRVLGEEHLDTLTTINNMGALIEDQGRLSEAEPYYREALEKDRRVLGEDHPSTLMLIGNLGTLLQSQGKLSEAEPYLRDALERYRRVFGEAHFGTLRSINNLAVLLKDQDKLNEAEPYFRETLLKLRQVQGEEHPNTMSSINNLGTLLLAEGKLTEAEPFFREALEKRRRILGPEHRDTLVSIRFMGALLVAQGKHADAARLLVPFDAITRKTFTGDNARRLAGFLMVLGKARTGLGEFAAAEASLLEAHPIFVQAPGPQHAKDLRTCTRGGRRSL